jgi:hypothetical protein
MTDSNKLELTQIKFADHCRNRAFFQNIKYHYDNFSEQLNLQALHIRRGHAHALFVINVYIGAKCSLSVPETVGIRVPARNVGNFSMFSCSSSHCPSARCVSPANAIIYNCSPVPEKHRGLKDKGLTVKWGLREPRLLLTVVKA